MPNVYFCGTKVVRGIQRPIPVYQCIKDFASLNNFMVVETADDGNCFYDTLSKFGARSGNPRVNKSHLDLRKQIIGTMIARKNEFAPFFVANVTVAPEAEVIQLNVDKELQKFLRPNQWAGWMGDIVPQVAADILGINIVIYDVIEREDENHIDRLEFTAGGVEAGTLQTVNMLRTNGSHFRLLWPKSAGIAPPRRRTAKKSLSPKPVAAAAAIRKSVSPKPVVTRKASTSPKPAIRRSERTRKAKPAAEVNYNEEVALKKAIEESLREAKNKRTSLERKMAELELASSYFNANSNNE